jgi:hypothetical protein
MGVLASLGLKDWFLETYTLINRNNICNKLNYLT